MTEIMEIIKTSGIDLKEKIDSYTQQTITKLTLENKAVSVICSIYLTLKKMLHNHQNVTFSTCYIQYLLNISKQNCISMIKITWETAHINFSTNFLNDC